MSTSALSFKDATAFLSESSGSISEKEALDAVDVVVRHRGYAQIRQVIQPAQAGPEERERQERELQSRQTADPISPSDNAKNSMRALIKQNPSSKSIMVNIVETIFYNLYDELRDLLCTKGRLSEALEVGGTDTRSIGAVLAASISASLGFSGPVSIGLSAFILVLVARSSVRAFCSLSKREIFTKAHTQLERARNS